MRAGNQISKVHSSIESIVISKILNIAALRPPCLKICIVIRVVFPILCWPSILFLFVRIRELQSVYCFQSFSSHCPKGQTHGFEGWYYFIFQKAAVGIDNSSHLSVCKVTLEGSTLGFSHSI